MQTMNKKFLTISSIILIAALSRLFYHLPNFTPVAAIALFGGAMFSNKKIAFLVPLAAMLISDLYLGFHQQMVWVYLSFALIVLIGTRLNENSNGIKVISASIASSLLFFIITNAADWYLFYSHNFQGLVECYTLALPFFRNTFAGDLVFSSLLFGSYYLIRTRIPALVTVKS